MAHVLVMPVAGVTIMSDKANIEIESDYAYINGHNLIVDGGCIRGFTRDF